LIVGSIGQIVKKKNNRQEMVEIFTVLDFLYLK